MILVRHGETQWSRQGRHTSRTDVPLTEEGRHQAAALGPRLLGLDGLALVLTSPRLRAMDTARASGFGEEAEVCDDLVEWDYGAVEGRTTAEIRADSPGWSLWRDGASGGETAHQVALRADRIIARAEAASGLVLVFSHGHLLRVLAARWLGLEPTEGRLFALAPASISELGFERETRVLSSWNLRVG